jgi:hypothetical protein
VVFVRLFGVFLCFLDFLALCFPLPFLVELLLELSNLERIIQDSLTRLFLLLFDCEEWIVADFS